MDGGHPTSPCKSHYLSSRLRTHGYSSHMSCTRNAMSSSIPSQTTPPALALTLLARRHENNLMHYDNHLYPSPLLLPQFRPRMSLNRDHFCVSRCESPANPFVHLSYISYIWSLPTLYVLHNISTSMVWLVSPKCKLL